MNLVFFVAIIFLFINYIVSLSLVLFILIIAANGNIKLFDNYIYISKKHFNDSAKYTVFYRRNGAVSFLDGTKKLHNERNQAFGNTNKLLEYWIDWVFLGNSINDHYYSRLEKFQREEKMINKISNFN